MNSPGQSLAHCGIRARNPQPRDRRAQTMLGSFRMVECCHPFRGTPSAADVHQGRPLPTVPEWFALGLLR